MFVVIDPDPLHCGEGNRTHCDLDTRPLNAKVYGLFIDEAAALAWVEENHLSTREIVAVNMVRN